MKSVLIADDHPIVLSGVEAILRDTSFMVVATATNGTEVLEALPTARPDILVLDLNMPERSGIDVLRTLRSRGDMRPVVLMTASLGDDALIEAIKLGVSGILLKDGAHDMLVHCLEDVRAGRRSIDNRLLDRALDLSMDGEGSSNPINSLTKRERTIAELTSHGLRNREIATELGMTEGTVKVYLHRIYGKLSVSSRTELAILIKDAFGSKS